MISGTGDPEELKLGDRTTQRDLSKKGRQQTAASGDRFRRWGITAVTEFTLTDRSGMDYPILIGRSFLKGRLLVDAGATDIANRGCGAEKW